MKTLFAYGGIFLLLIGLAWTTTAYVTYSNQFASLTAQYEAQDRVNQTIYDEVWKTVKQEANITDVYATKFKEIYVQVMDARYKDGAGQLMQWITEQNPNFTPELYGRLMNTIEAKRAEFTNNQKTLIAIHAELRKLTTTIPARWFLGGKTIPEPRLVTSTRTGDAFRTGKDDDTSPYPDSTTK